MQREILHCNCLISADRLRGTTLHLVEEVIVGSVVTLLSTSQHAQDYMISLAA